jgi:dimethylaniline monooxygenase (N-oxide forming)
MALPTKVVVIGAGWSGLVAARTYLHICKLLNRPIELTIIDESNGPGGVWSPKRLYPGLLANSPVGLYEFSHLSMVNEKHPWYQLLPGTYVQEYLEAYTRKFDLFSRTRFGTKVLSARRRGPGKNSGWIVETDQGDTLECDKLVVATGLYSKPRIPDIDMSTYTGVSIHQHGLGRNHEALRADPLIENVVVVGAAKSALEACNVFLPHMNPDKKHTVNWVVRPSEQGVPMIVQDTEKVGNIIAVNQTRLFAQISASIYTTTGFFYRFLHSGKNWLGSLIISTIWRVMSWELSKGAKFEASENGRKIKPDGSSYFFNINVISLIPHDSKFLQALHRDDDSILKVHRASPMRLEGKQMVLLSPDGTTTRIPCDAVIWSTGWLPALDFFSEADRKSMGLPIVLPQDTAKGSQESENMKLANPLPAAAYMPESEAARKSEEEILRLFPALRAPAKNSYSPPYTAYRLYRHGIPVSALPDSSDPEDQYDRSVSFPGMISNSQTAICSEITALYCVAYMEDLIPHSSLPKSRAEAEADVELKLAFARRRYGVRGGRDPEVVLEVQSFLDQICRDLGVGIWRKRKRLGLDDGQEGAARNKGVGLWASLKGWYTEFCTPYFATDYNEVTEEFLERNNLKE